MYGQADRVPSLSAMVLNAAVLQPHGWERAPFDLHGKCRQDSDCQNTEKHFCPSADLAQTGRLGQIALLRNHSDLSFRSNSIARLLATSGESGPPDRLEL